MAAHIYHWKHGWIPLDHYAALKKAHGSHAGALRALERSHAGGHAHYSVAKEHTFGGGTHLKGAHGYKPVAAEHLHRHESIIAAHHPATRSFAVHGTGTQLSTGITEKTAQELYSNGESIRAVNRDTQGKHYLLVTSKGGGIRRVEADAHDAHEVMPPKAPRKPRASRPATAKPGKPDGTKPDGGHVGKTVGSGWAGVAPSDHFAANGHRGAGVSRVYTKGNKTIQIHKDAPLTDHEAEAFLGRVDDALSTTAHHNGGHPLTFQVNSPRSDKNMRGAHAYVYVGDDKAVYVDHETAKRSAQDKLTKVDVNHGHGHSMEAGSHIHHTHYVLTHELGHIHDNRMKRQSQGGQGMFNSPQEKAAEGRFHGAHVRAGGQSRYGAHGNGSGDSKKAEGYAEAYAHYHLAGLQTEQDRRKLTADIRARYATQDKTAAAYADRYGWGAAPNGKSFSAQVDDKLSGGQVAADTVAGSHYGHLKDQPDYALHAEYARVRDNLDGGLGAHAQADHEARLKELTGMIRRREIGRSLTGGTPHEGAYNAGRPMSDADPSNADKIRNAETMFGTGSAQHRAALAKFGGDAGPSKATVGRMSTAQLERELKSPKLSPALKSVLAAELRRRTR